MTGLQIDFFALLILAVFSDYRSLLDYMVGIESRTFGLNVVLAVPTLAVLSRVDLGLTILPAWEALLKLVVRSAYLIEL